MKMRLLCLFILSPYTLIYASTVTVSNTTEKPYFLKLTGRDLFEGDYCEESPIRIEPKASITLSPQTCIEESVLLIPIEDQGKAIDWGQAGGNFIIKDVDGKTQLINAEKAKAEEEKEKSKEGVPPVKVEPKPEEPATTSKAIEAGPIWDQKDAEGKCPNTCSHHKLQWDSNWWTTVSGKMSVCSCKS